MGPASGSDSNRSPDNSPPRKGQHGREEEMFGMIRNLWQDESGATAVEYGIMVALIAAIIIVTVAAIGQKILGAFNLVNTNLP
jgi:pilus assembly protein Flp/PilA